MLLLFQSLVFLLHLMGLFVVLVFSQLVLDLLEIQHFTGLLSVHGNAVVQFERELLQLLVVSLGEFLVEEVGLEEIVVRPLVPQDVEVMEVLEMALLELQ